MDTDAQAAGGDYQVRERPQFFIDLERELAGLEPEEMPQEAAPILYDEALLPNSLSAFLANPLRSIPVNLSAHVRLSDAVSYLQPGIENQTATGAMIAAHQYWQGAQMLAQLPHPQWAYMACQQDQRQGGGVGHALGSIWDALGGGFRS
jgi:hypothetical protein